MVRGALNLGDIPVGCLVADKGILIKGLRTMKVEVIKYLSITMNYASPFIKTENSDVFI